MNTFYSSHSISFSISYVTVITVPESREIWISIKEAQESAKSMLLNFGAGSKVE